jgi:hypothetical protein
MIALAAGAAHPIVQYILFSQGYQGSNEIRGRGGISGLLRHAMRAGRNTAVFLPSIRTELSNLVAAVVHWPLPIAMEVVRTGLAVADDARAQERRGAG